MQFPSASGGDGGARGSIMVSSVLFVVRGNCIDRMTQARHVGPTHPSLPILGEQVDADHHGVPGRERRFDRLLSGLHVVVCQGQASIEKPCGREGRVFMTVGFREKNRMKCHKHHVLGSGQVWPWLPWPNIHPPLLSQPPVLNQYWPIVSCVAWLRIQTWTKPCTAVIKRVMKRNNKNGFDFFHVVNFCGFFNSFRNMTLPFVLSLLQTLGAFAIIQLASMTAWRNAYPRANKRGGV